MIRCLAGSVEINGKSFDDTSEEFFDIASIEGSSLLCIADKSETCISGDSGKSKIIAKLKSSKLVKEDDRNELSSLLDFVLTLDSVSSCLVVRKNKDSLVFPFLDKMNGICNSNRSFEVTSYCCYIFMVGKGQN